MPKLSDFQQDPYQKSDSKRFDAECKTVVEQGMKFDSHTEMARYFFEVGRAWEHGKKVQKHHVPVDWEVVAKTAAYYANGYEHTHSKFGPDVMLGIGGIDPYSYNSQKYSGMNFKFSMDRLVAFVEEMLKIYL